ncbi:MAG: hypothetical protein PHX14_11915, partial [Syntrophomonadaceae bacterium]|nr:hypothetical protein [Syntrophomonadaceae bacterium]
MNKKFISITILMLLITALLPGIVLGSSTTLNLNIISAPVRTTVTASGSTDPNTWMSIKILDNTQSIVLSDPFKSDSNGNYSREFIVPPNVSSGVSLIVVAGYGSNVANQVLAVTAPGSAVVPADVSEPANPVDSGADDPT